MAVREGVDPFGIRGYAKEVTTHLDVAETIRVGNADVGIAAESVAHLTGLRFHRLFEERFDVVTYKETFFDENVQAFVEFVRCDAFRGQLEAVPGYSCRLTGKVLYPRV